MTWSKLRHFLATRHGIFNYSARVVQQVAAIERLDEFNPASDSIIAYVERAQLFMEANNVPDDKHVALFLSALGRELKWAGPYSSDFT